jgi:predicted NAD/FAD-binding protein
LLAAFPYEPNTAVLHTDTRVLPNRRRAWAAWNYRIGSRDAGKTTVTYNMNILQRIESRHVFCVTLNNTDGIDESKVLKRIRYAHPIFTTQRSVAQQRHDEVIRTNRTSFCGAYWGYGFHEDGVNSALAVCQAFERQPVHLPAATGTQGADNAQLSV